MATQPTNEEEIPSRAVALSPQRESYAIMKDQAKLFSISRLLPEAVRGNSPDEAMANCLIALQMAQAMDELPFMVMQNIHIVKGKAGFAAQFMIARANASGVFKGRINWDVDRSDPNNLSVTAFGYLSDTGERVEFTVDMKMAQAEGWTSNSKYKSIPELMLRYRSATFLVRLYAPDVMLGYRTADELEDIGAAVTTTPSLTGDMLRDQSRVEPEETAADTENKGEIIDAEATAVAEPEQPKAARAKAKAKDAEAPTEQPKAPSEGTEAPSSSQPERDEQTGVTKDPFEEAAEVYLERFNKAETVIDLARAHDEFERESDGWPYEIVQAFERGHADNVKRLAPAKAAETAAAK